MKTLAELAQAAARVRAEELELWVSEGWVEATLVETEWQFTEAAEARVHLICDLRHDMAVNDEAIPLILDLMDQLYATRRQLKALAAAVEAQPEDIRQLVQEAVTAKAKSI
ncbi:MAG: chaperone modulator CbpM [Acetobacterales bacterium]